MSTQQRHPTVPIAVMVVLLLYLLAAFISASLSASGAAKIWVEAAMRGTLAIAGLMLYVVYVVRVRFESAPQRMDLRCGILLTVGLTVLLVASECSWLLSRVNAPEFSKLPDLGVFAIQLALGAVGEELLFVGFLYGVLRLRISSTTSVVCVGALFVLLHWPTNVTAVAARAIYIFCSCALFERARVIGLNVVLHCTVNTVTLAFVLRFAGSVPPESVRVLAAPVAIAFGCAAVLLALWAGLAPSHIRRSTHASDTPALR